MDDPHRSFKLNRAAKNVRSLHECRILSNIKQVERFILSCFLVSPTLDSFKLLMKHKRSQDAFRSFTTTKADFFFYQTVHKLNNCKDPVRWLELAVRIYFDYIAVYSKALGSSKVSMPVIPYAVRGILADVFTGVDANNLSPLSDEASLVVKNAYETCEIETELLLAKTVHEFVGSHHFLLWRLVERGYAMGLTQHDIVEKERLIGEKEAGGGGDGLLKSIGKRSAKLVDSIVSRISGKGDKKQNSESESCVVIEDIPKVLNYHPYSCDAWLGVLLESSKFLPIGVALHGIVKPTSQSVSGDLSASGASKSRDQESLDERSADPIAKDCTYPYLFVNGTYADNCGGFSADDLQQRPHDFMYLHHTQQSPTMAASPHPVTDKDDKFVLADMDGLLGYPSSDAASKGNERSAAASTVPSKSSDGGEKSIAVPARYSFSFCHSQNIQGLYMALVGLKTIITSIPMRYSNEKHGIDTAAENGDFLKDVRRDGYVSVCAWKPLKTATKRAKKNIHQLHKSSGGSGRIAPAGCRDGGKDMMEGEEFKEPESIYYICLQVSVPVAEIYYGLTYVEAQQVCLTIKHLNSLVDMIPETLDPTSYGRPL